MAINSTKENSSLSYELAVGKAMLLVSILPLVMIYGLFDAVYISSNVRF